MLNMNKGYNKKKQKLISIKFLFINNFLIYYTDNLLGYRYKCKKM